MHSANEVILGLTGLRQEVGEVMLYYRTSKYSTENFRYWPKLIEYLHPSWVSITRAIRILTLWKWDDKAGR